MGVPGVVWTACMPASGGGCTGRRMTGSPRPDTVRARVPTDRVQRGPPCPCDSPDWQERAGSVGNVICAAKPRVRHGGVIPQVGILLAGRTRGSSDTRRGGLALQPAHLHHILLAGFHQ